MNKKPIKILAIETSCDETAAAVIGVERNGSQIKSGMTGLNPVILSNIVASQIDLHAKTGGVVPEVASRAHMESMIPVVAQALLQSEITNNQPSTANQQSTSNDHLEVVKLIENCKLEIENYQEAIRILGSEITHIAVTSGPGLIGSLLVGFNAAKTLAYSLDLPVVPINHIEGHIYSAFNSIAAEQRRSGVAEETLLRGFSASQTLKFPVLALTVSGGHTSLTLMHDHGKYETIGATVDDAVGEAYDKVARLLGLGYPGGPQISKLAEHCRSGAAEQQGSRAGTPLRGFSASRTLIFPRPMINDGTFNFSFSGLKTAVLQRVLNIKKLNGELNETDKEEICAAFEEAVAEVLAVKTAKAVEKYQPCSVIFAGGVSANEYLAERIELGIRNQELGDGQATEIPFLTPPRELTGDNAAMIGLASYYHILRGDVKKWSEISVDSNLEL